MADCELAENELGRLREDFRKPDLVINKLKAQATKGQHVSCIIKFASMLPDIISLARSIPKLERRIDHLSDSINAAQKRTAQAH